MKEYLDLVRHVLDNGTVKENRTGVSTLSSFGYFYKIDISRGFPLLTTKKIKWEAVVIELLWFLSKSNDLTFLQKYGISFWNPWNSGDNTTPTQYHYFRKFPGINWDVVVDQIDLIVKELASNPMSRRLVLSAWHPDAAFGITEQVAGNLPPCHLLSIFNVQKESNGDLSLNLSLMQRSCDVGVGASINIASYALLLSLIGWIVNIKSKEFAHSIVDAHIYSGKVEGDEYDHRPTLRKQLERVPAKLPDLMFNPSNKNFDYSTVEGRFKYVMEYLVSGSAPKEEIMNFFHLVNYHPASVLPLKTPV